MKENQESYKQIIKATSIFGGVQFIQIIVGVIRSKFIAVLLGPAGMGISGLLTTTIGFVGSLTNFGLSTSAVKNIAAAFGTDNSHQIAKVVGVMRKLVWITGVLGMVLTLILSPWLSQWTFGNNDYTLVFMALSIVLLVNQLTSGQNVLLQGTRKINYLSKASLIGSILSLLTSIPLYYLYGIKGIVPAMIVSSIVALVISYYFSRKIQIPEISITIQDLKTEGKEMLTLGFMLSLSGFISIGASYIIRIFISRTGSVDDVGFYNAGFAIITTYVGMIFSAMVTDYYPRLSGVAHNNAESTKIINHQAEIALLIIGPVIVVFLVFIKWVIVLFYSNQFLPIIEMMLYAGLGMFFRAASWSVAFLFLAKGSTKLFFQNELLANFYMLILNLLGFHYFGLNGLGIAFLLGYILYLIQVFFIAKVKYQFNFDKAFWKIFIVQNIFGFIVFSLVFFVDNQYLKYIAGLFLILASSGFSLYELNKRISLGLMLQSLKNKLYGARNDQ